MKLKFTIQHMLWATFAFGFVAILMSAAFRGNLVAKGVLLMPFTMIITFAVLAAIYWPCYLVSRLLYPPIHTSAQVSFQTEHTGYENDSADSPITNANPPVDEDVSTGAPE